MPELTYTHSDVAESYTVVAPEGIAEAVTRGMEEQGWVLQDTAETGAVAATQATPNVAAARVSPRLSSKPQTAATPEGN